MEQRDDPINYQRLYQYRFRGVDQSERQAVWNEIGPFVHRLMGSPRRVLDPAAGRGEFVNALTGVECWVVDAVAYNEAHLRDGVRFVLGDAAEVDLPAGHFDGVFVSNFLEHLPTQGEVARFLANVRAAMAPGGRVAVMGPNFRYCAKTYFDCADHVLALTHVAVEEHLYAAGFEVERSVPRFLPYSFRSALPAWPVLTRAYLRTPAAWPVLGRQFLVVGRLPTAA